MSENKSNKFSGCNIIVNLLQVGGIRLERVLEHHLHHCRMFIYVVWSVLLRGRGWEGGDGRMGVRVSLTGRSHAHTLTASTKKNKE